MKPDAPAGEICRTCLQLKVADLCGCTGLSRPGPREVALRAAGAVQELGQRGREGVYLMREE